MLQEQYTMSVCVFILYTVAIIFMFIIYLSVHGVNPYKVLYGLISSTINSFHIKLTKAFKVCESPGFSSVSLTKLFCLIQNSFYYSYEILYYNKYIHFNFPLFVLFTSLLTIINYKIILQNNYFICYPICISYISLPSLYITSIFLKLYFKCE